MFVTRVPPSSLAARAGLAPGDRIYALDGRPVAGDQDLLGQLRAALGGPVRYFTLLVETAGRVRTVVINRTALNNPATDATL